MYQFLTLIINGTHIYIKTILTNHYPDKSEDIYDKSLLIQYINIKTKSAQRGAKSRSSFANLYSIYVLIEDYINQGFEHKGTYSKYEGALFSNLLNRMREMPFGAKLQNHALNHRMNEEFKKYFPDCEFIPIIRDTRTSRYWINENLLKVRVNRKIYNIANIIIEIINNYIKVKTDSFNLFIEQCKQLENISKNNEDNIVSFIYDLLNPNVDARLFEIVSYAILKQYYKNEKIFWGFSRENLKEDYLRLYKTGRTNANDGGIDFVMQPLGKFFQVTETVDFKKYFLNIDKIEHYPITFVVKSEESIDALSKKIHGDAMKLYGIEAIVKKYMDCIEELINISKIKEYFNVTKERGDLPGILNEIIIQSEIEFNFNKEE